MGFIDEIGAMPLSIIRKMVFKDRMIFILFKSGNCMSAICPEGNDQYEILKAEMLNKLGKEKVDIHDN
jgi:hypothetical protein